MTSRESGLPNSWASGNLWCMTDRVPVVTFIGAGGKTTCLQRLTQEIHSAGCRVIATTTTKVYPEKAMKGWENADDPPAWEQEGVDFWYAKVEEKSGKWIGPSLSAVDAAIVSKKIVPDVGAIHELPLHASPRSVSDLHWVIEGDGARGLQLKCWESHEPQIPSNSNCAVLVLDGGLWGNVLQAEQVHRSANCLDLIGQVWNAEQVWRYCLRSPVFAPQYQHLAWVMLMNCHEDKLKKDSLEPLKSLFDLFQRWTVIQREVEDLEYRPVHLRLAVGDVKEGRLLWFDLW